MTRSYRLLGIVLSATILSGCATSRTFFSSQLWPWKQKNDATQGLTADLSRPFPEAPAADPVVTAAFEYSHPLVDQQISRFQESQRGFYERALARSARYVPVMEAILERHGIPKEIAYLPLIESGYECSAVSPAGAVGPWQFMHATGLRYGLRIDRMVDERRDPIKSTEAAARYLSDLYDMFENWHLALAAYNTGEGNVGRALQSSKANDYWSMVDKGCLHSETEAYVPRFLAASQIAKQPELFGFEMPDPDPISYDWVRVNRPLSLAKVADMSGTDVATLKQLNPALRQATVPPSGYIVKLPKGTKRTYQVAVNQVDPSLGAWNPARKSCDNDESVHCVVRGDTYAAIAEKYGVSVGELLAVNGRSPRHKLRAGESVAIPGRAPSNEDEADAAVRTDAAPAKPAATHTVRKGDNAAAIAKRYGVSVDRLVAANRLRNPRSLQVGQKLTIPGTSRTATASASTGSGSVRVHSLRSGETLAVVAKRYGVSMKELQRANNIRDTRRMKVGQKIRVPGAPSQRAKAAPPVAPTTVAKAAKPAAASNASNVHRVRKGDTPASIARRYGVPVASLMKANGLRQSGNLQINQALVIPSSTGTKTAKTTASGSAPSAAKGKSTIHTVRSGDTPASIAKRHGISVEALLKANGVRNPRGLKPGQKLTVPPSQASRGGGKTAG